MKYTGKPNVLPSRAAAKTGTAGLLLVVPLLSVLLGCTPESGRTFASISVKGGEPHFEGLNANPALLPNSIEVVAGPLGEVVGMRTDASLHVRGVLDTPLEGPGSLAFWFYTGQYYRSGSEMDYQEQTLVEIPDVITVCFVAEPSSINLYIGWGERRDVATRGAGGVRTGIAFDRVIRILLPEWPGPDWHHLAVQWDSDSGESNAFVNGTPFHIRGSRIAPWKSKVGRELGVWLNPDFALADIRVSSSMIAEDELTTIVGKEHLGRLDSLLGASDYGRLDVASRRGQLIYARDLDNVDDVVDWVIEGPGAVSFEDGWMEVRSTRPEGPNGHVVYWPKEDFPESILVEFDFEILSRSGLNILFFAASGHGGLDLFDPRLTARDGAFIDYTHGDIDSYHISYFANMPNEPRAVSNLRKNTGFYLLANGPVATARGGTGTVHHATLMKDGKHIKMAVDGQTLIEFIDDGRRAGPVWGRGKIGFRQMQWTVTRYRDLRVHELVARN